MSNKDNFFIKSFFVIGGGTFLNMVISLLTTPIITRIVVPESYGQLSIFLVYSNIALNILTVGLDQSFVRFYFDHDSIEYKRSLLRKCVCIPLLLVAICSVAIFISIQSGILPWEFSGFVTVLLFIHICSTVTYTFSLMVVRMEKRANLFSFLRIMQKALYVVIVLLMLNATQIEHFTVLASATTLVEVVCLTISVWATKQYWQFGEGLAQDQASGKELIKYGYPFIFSAAIGSLFQAIDKLSLNMYCTYTEVGIYASAMSLVSIFAIVQTTFNTLWAPIALEHYAKAPEDADFYSKANKIITVIMFFLGISLILCKDLFAVLLGEKYRHCAFMLPFLIFQPIMYTISETTCLGLVFKKKSKLQVWVALVPCITNLIGNTILVPIYGGVGAAISTGLSYIVFFAVRTVLSNRYYKVNYQLKSFSAVTAVVCVYAFYNTRNRFGVGSVIGYLLCTVVLVLMYRDTVRVCIDYGKTIVLDILKKGYAKLHK